MDPSALESVSRSFESSLDWWGAFILVSTAVVAIGLVIEYWEPIREFIEEWRRPAAAFPWRKFMGLTGGILVTVGVVGEFWGTYKAFRIETKLRDNNHQIEGLLNKEADEARQKAGEANKAAEDERVARVQIEEALAPRRLTTEQRLAISSGLSRFSKQPVVAFNNTFDVEAAVLAAEILSTLKQAKWYMHPTFMIGRPVSWWAKAPSISVTGIFIEATLDKRSQLAAKALARELSNNGFDCRKQEKGLLGSSLPFPLVLIDIEPRPEGPQGEAKLRADAKKRQANSNQTAKP